MDHGRAGVERRLHVDDGRQLLPVDLDLLRPRPRPAARVSATTAATASPCQQARSSAMACCGADFMPLRCASTPTQGVQMLRELARRSNDARCTPGAAARRARIDADDARVGVRAAHEGDVRHARQHDVVDVLRRAPARRRAAFGRGTELADVAVRPVEHGAAGLRVVAHGFASRCRFAAVSTASTIA